MARDARVELRVTAAERERFFAAAGGAREFSSWARTTLLAAAGVSDATYVDAGADPPLPAAKSDPPLPTLLAGSVAVSEQRPEALEQTAVPPQPVEPRVLPKPKARRSRRERRPSVQLGSKPRSSMCPHRVGPDQFCKTCDVG